MCGNDFARLAQTGDPHTLSYEWDVAIAARR